MDVWTIGHSTRPAETFVGYLQAHEIRTLADIRRFPASRRNPQFNTDELKKALFHAGIQYVYLGDELGGFRKPAPGSPHVALRGSAFQGYADHLRSTLYEAGIQRLLQVAAAGPTCVMCAESNWKSCHRRILSDDLVLRHGVTVTHIHDQTTTFPHQPTPAARVVEGRLVYAQGPLDRWSPGT